MLVTERIEYDFGSTEHHGIFRDIPSRLTYDNRYDRVYPIEVVSVTASPGTPAQYETSQSGPIFEIKIGDPDRTITGDHTYTITYRVRGRRSTTSPTTTSSTGTSPAISGRCRSSRCDATVTIPGQVERVACFAGEFGSSLSCDQADFEGDTATFAASNLGPFQGMSVVVGFPTGLVQHTGPILKERWSLGRAFQLTPATGGAGGLLLGAAAVRRRVAGVADRPGPPAPSGRSSTRRSRPPDRPSSRCRCSSTARRRLSTPRPEDIRPGQMGTLVDEVANPLDVSATVVDLAVRGYLKIEEIPKHGLFGKPDWKLTLLEARRRRPAPLRARAGRRLVRGRRRGAAVGPEAEVRRPADEGAERAVRRRGEARMVHAPAGHRPRVLGPDRCPRPGGGRARSCTSRPDSRTSAWSRVPLVIGAIALAGVGEADAAQDAGRHRDGPPRLRVPDVHRDRRGAGDAVPGKGEHLLEVPSVRDRVRLHGEVGEARSSSSASSRTPARGTSSPHPSRALAFASSIDHFSVATVGTISSTPAGSGSSGFGGGGFSGGGGGGGGGGSW